MFGNHSVQSPAVLRDQGSVRDVVGGEGEGEVFFGYNHGGESEERLRSSSYHDLYISEAHGESYACLSMLRCQFSGNRLSEPLQPVGLGAADDPEAQQGPVVVLTCYGEGEHATEPEKYGE